MKRYQRRVTLAYYTQSMTNQGADWQTLQTRKCARDSLRSQSPSWKVNGYLFTARAQANSTKKKRERKKSSPRDNAIINRTQRRRAANAPRARADFRAARSGYLLARRRIGGASPATGAKSISACAIFHGRSLLALSGKGEIAKRRDIRETVADSQESRAIGTAPQAASPVDWHNLFNTFSARWGHRRRRRETLH